MLTDASLSNDRKSKQVDNKINGEKVVSKTVLPPEEVDDRPMLIVITTTTCGSCELFKTGILPELITLMMVEQKYQMLHQSRYTLDEPAKIYFTSLYPRLKYEIRQLPTIILIDANSWNYRDTDKFWIFNRYSNGDVKESPDTDAWSPTGIFKWMEACIADEIPPTPVLTPAQIQEQITKYTIREQERQRLAAISASTNSQVSNEYTTNIVLKPRSTKK